MERILTIMTSRLHAFVRRYMTNILDILLFVVVLCYQDGQITELVTNRAGTAGGIPAVAAQEPAETAEQTGGISMRSAAMNSGVAVGLVVGIILVVFILRFINRNKKVTTDYDERQKQIRGEGYKIAFYAIVIYEAVMCIISPLPDLPVEPYMLHALAIFFGVLVQVCYCIWKGAYIGQNTNMPRFIVIMTIISLFNLFIAFIAWRQGFLIIDGKLQAQGVNLICGLMFAAIGIVGLVRKLTDHAEEEEA